MNLLDAYEKPGKSVPGRVERAAVLRELSEDGKRARVEYLDTDVWLPLGPGQFVVGGLVSVLEESGRPVRVLAPLSDSPVDSVDGEEQSVVPVVSWAGSVLEPREITAEERARIEETALGLETAQQELADARTEAEQNFGTLDDKLGQAFPDDIFDVNLAIEQAKDLAEQKFNDSITGTVVEYARNSNETSAPTTGWSTTAPDRTPGTFIWMRTTVSYGSGDATTTDPVLLTGNDGAQGPKGDKGAEGDEGVSVESITPHFRRLADSEAKPAKPTGMIPSGWVEVEPDYARDTTMWRSDRIVFSNGQVTWTDVSKSSSYEAAKAAEAAALAYADQMKQEAIDAGAIDLANLQIGGRNLIRDSVRNTTSSDYILDTMNLGDRPPLHGETVTISIKGEMGADRSNFTVYNSGGSLNIRPNILPADRGPDGVYRATLTWRTENDSGYVADNTHMRIYQAPSSGVSESTIEWVKLERGSKATDWTPAPEDVDAGIADAQEAADAADGKADTAIADASTAMSMASGKNAASYTDVADSVAEPGPAPTLEMGLGRRQFDVHRNRRSNGQIIGEWIWTGTAWSRLTLSDAMLSSLDVGKLTAGTANVETGVVNKLWADGISARTAQFSRATVAARNMIPGIETLATYGDLSAEDRATLPFREFGINTTDPSISLQGRKSGWIWAQIPVVAGERYRWSVDVRGSVPGTVFYIQTLTANSDGSRGTNFSGWTEWKRSPNVGSSGTSYPFFNTVAGTEYESYWVEATATTSGVISLYIWANHTNGAANDDGYQWFRNLSMRAMTDGNMLVDGAVTARHLNVVPEQGSGGLQLTPDGMMVVDADGSGSVDLRVGTDNYLSFYRDEAVNFSVSADGALTAQDVSANANLLYRGTELSELLDSFARGTVYLTAVEAGPHRIQNASYTSRLAYIQAQKPETGRRWRIWATYEAMGNSSTGADSWNRFVFAFNGGLHYNQDTWQIINQGYQRVPATSLYDQRLLVAEVRTHALPWSEAGNGIFSINMTNIDGSSFNVRNIRFWIEDVGSSATASASPSTPWIRPEVGSDVAPTPTEQRHTSTWNMSGFQNYLAGVRVTHVSGNIAGGYYYGGEGRGVMFFPHASIASALSGATIDKVEIYLQNAHTYAPSGSTVLIGSHNYASAPASSPAVAARASQHFGRGQGRWVTLPAAVGTGFANGTIKGLAVYGGSTANYATWTPSAPKIRVSYTK